MKKIFLILLIGLLSACSSTENLTKENEKISYIAQADCDTETGNGLVEFRSIEDTKLISTWYKVIASPICSEKIDSLYFLTKASKLTDAGARNTFKTYVELSEPVLNKDGDVVDFKLYGKVNKEKLHNITEHTELNRYEAHKWYFNQKIKRFKVY